jgi:DNA-binding NtrC family response regulator
LPPIISLEDRTFTIGRGEANHLVLRNDDAASRVHAQLRRIEDHVVLTDLGSTNGTWVGGRRITEHGLAEQDVIRIGNTLFCFLVTEAGAGDCATWGTGDVALGGSRMRARAEHALRNLCAEQLALVSGETGTGKEEFARALHAGSGRAGPFVRVCSTDRGIESALFGEPSRPLASGSTLQSLVSRADGGTLFLDEVSDLPFEAQTKLERLLSERSLWPLGARAPQPIDVQVVCATRLSLQSLSASGLLRAELMNRFARSSVSLPPLRERREDLGFWVTHFLRAAGRAELRVCVSFMEVLSRYAFPGNLPELAALVKEAVGLANAGALSAQQLPEALRAIHADEPTRPVVLRESSDTVRKRPLVRPGSHAGPAASN